MKQMAHWAVPGEDNTALITEKQSRSTSPLSHIEEYRRETTPTSQHFTSIHAYLEAMGKREKRESIPAQPAPRTEKQAKRQKHSHESLLKVSTELVTKPAKPVTKPFSYEDQIATFGLIRSTPLLNREQERELLTRYQRFGDQEALTHLITSNVRLVASIAIPYARLCRVDLDDLMQVGLIGLVHALDTFDLSTPHKLSTHATNHIRARVVHALPHYVHAVYLPERLYYALRKVRHLLASPKTAPVTLEALAAHTGESIETVQALLYWLRPASSLDAPISSDGDTPLVELVSRCDDKDAYSEICEQDEQSGLVATLLATVSDERKREVIRLYYGIGCDRLTLREIGKRLRITQEWVRQLRDAALEEMRAAAAGVEVQA